MIGISVIMQKRKPCGQSVDGQAREHLQASEGLGLESLPDEIAKLQPKDSCLRVTGTSAARLPISK